MFAFDVDTGLRVALLEHHHADPLYRLVLANRERLGRWLPWAWEASLESQSAFIERGLEQFAQGDGFQAGVWLGSELAGGIGLHYLDRVVGVTEVGYWLGSDFEGRGIMVRSVAATCRLLFGEYGLRRVEISCHPDNARSRAVPTRLGFREEEVLAQPGSDQERVVYRLVREDWRGGA